MQTTTFGERLEEALRLAGQDRQRLAKALGVSVQAISHVILGKTQSLTAENAARAARFTGTDYFWLCTGEGHPRTGVPESRWPLSISQMELERLSDAQRKSLDVIVSEFVNSVATSTRPAS